MRNPEYTKNIILEKASILFNSKGYKATSISDITTETKMTKGAIYKHFKNKEALEMDAFNHMLSIVSEQLRAKIKAQDSAPTKLRAMLTFFQSYVSMPIIKGGCPLLNTAIEFDDTKADIKKLARKSLLDFKNTIVHILKNGKKYNQIDENLDEEKFASYLFASVEGGIMVSKLSGKNDDILAVIEYLHQSINHITKVV